MKNHRNLEWCKGKNVDLVKSFQTRIYYLLAKFAFDTAENEPPKGSTKCMLSRTRLVIPEFEMLPARCTRSEFAAGRNVHDRVPLLLRAGRRGAGQPALRNVSDSGYWRRTLSVRKFSEGQILVVSTPIQARNGAFLSTLFLLSLDALK